MASRKRMMPDPLFTVAQYLTSPGRRVARETFRNFVDGVQRRFNFADVIGMEELEACPPFSDFSELSDQYPTFSWLQINTLRTKFNFEGLKLLNVNAFDAIGCTVQPNANLPHQLPIGTQFQTILDALPSQRMDELRTIINDIPALRVVFVIREPKEIQVTDILAMKMDGLRGWEECDRWRIAAMCREKRRADGHRRVVDYYWKDSYGRALLMFKMWVQEIVLEADGEQDWPVGDFLLLRKISVEFPCDKFVNWLTQINAPLLCEISSLGSELTFEIPKSHCWVGQNVKLHLNGAEPVPEQLLTCMESRHGRKALFVEINKGASLVEDEEEAFWFPRRERWWAELRTLCWDGPPTCMLDSLPVDAKVTFSCLRTICLCRMGDGDIPRWSQFLSRVTMPVLESLVFNDMACRSTAASNVAAVDLLRLPSISAISRLDVGRLSYVLLTTDRPINLPLLTHLQIDVTVGWEHYKEGALVGPLQHVVCCRPCRISDWTEITRIMAKIFPAANVVYEDHREVRFEAYRR